MLLKGRAFIEILELPNTLLLYREGDVEYEAGENTRIVLGSMLRGAALLVQPRKARARARLPPHVTQLPLYANATVFSWNSYKMSDSPASATGAIPAPNANDQARIRRERREAKIRAGGASRLNKITGLSGGLQRGKLQLCRYF